MSYQFVAEAANIVERRMTRSMTLKQAERRKTKYNKKNARLRQRVSTRRSLASYNRLAFQYDPIANYSDDENVDIGPMTTICRYCNALKFKRKTAGLCCASGEVKLDPLLIPRQPLKPLFDGSDLDSSHFLQHILEYNICFCMTSFGANIIREGGFMPTCKIQGQIYHLHGSMVPTPNEPHQFLQIYFISSMVDQLNVRCNIQGTQQLKRRIIEQLQTFFHANNATSDNTSKEAKEAGRMKTRSMTKKFDIEHKKGAEYQPLQKKIKIEDGAEDHSLAEVNRSLEEAASTSGIIPSSVINNDTNTIGKMIATQIKNEPLHDGFDEEMNETEIESMQEDFAQKCNRLIDELEILGVPLVVEAPLDTPPPVEESIPSDDAMAEPDLSFFHIGNGPQDMCDLRRFWNRVLVENIGSFNLNETTEIYYAHNIAYVLDSANGVLLVIRNVFLGDEHNNAMFFLYGSNNFVV